MDSKATLQNALREVSSAGSEIVQYLEKLSSLDANFTQDPFALGSSKNISDTLTKPLKHLAEATAQLLQFATDPKDYLAQLAASVGLFHDHCNPVRPLTTFSA